MHSRLLRNTVVTMIAGLVFASPAISSLRLKIPRLELNVSLNYISQDPSPLVYFQDRNTIAIAGHRVTHTHPFYYIDTLRYGDSIYVTYKGYQNHYIVSRIYSQIKPENVRKFTHFAGVVISACTPRHSATYRYVVVGYLKSVRKIR